MDKVSFVLTSCGRLNLLGKTLESFKKFNTYPIDQFIIIDDSGDPSVRSQMEKDYPEYTLIFNEERIGQIKSIDRAYAEVKNPYIFHCEDDWEFYRAGFIEDSLSLLKMDDKFLMIWLRELNDMNGHPIDPGTYSRGEVNYHFVSLNWKGGWCGFTFNPGLRRLKDYELIKPYSSVPITHNFHKKKFYVQELEISKKYGEMGFRGVILRKGAVKHIGWDSHIKND